MNLTAQQFNEKYPIGTDLLYFPNGDQMPIHTVRVKDVAIVGMNLNTSVTVELGNEVGLVPVSLLEHCSQDSFDEIIMLLDTD